MSPLLSSPVRVLLLLMAVLAVVPARAQAVRQFEAGFERDVNRYRWEALLRLDQPLAGWHLTLQDRFTSDAYLLFQDRLSFRDENQLAWTLARPVGTRFTSRLFGQAGWYTQSRVFSQEVYAGLRYAPRPYLWVEPALGAAVDQRPGVAVAGGAPPLRLDAGPAVGLRAALAPPPLDDYRVRLQAEGTWHAINPRRGRALRLDGTAERTFERVRLAATLGLASFRRDAYQAVSFLNRGTPTGRLSETVEATTSDTLAARLTLEAPLFRGLRLAGLFDFSTNDRYTRTLRAPDEVLFFDTDFNRRALEAEVALQYERQAWMARLSVRGGAEVEHRALTNREALPPAQAAQKSNLLQQADYDQGLVVLGAQARAPLGRRVVLAFNGSSSILRHDTPEANLDDRDELYHNGQLGLQLHLSRYLQADVQLFGTYYHTVFINAERSAENNTQRSLRLRPGVQWTPTPATRLRLSSEIRATYTVDDFVLPGRRPSDQSARELRYDAGLEHDFGRGVRLFASASTSALHLGRLLWDQFAEIPFDTLRTRSGWIHLQAGRRVVADIGVRFFTRSDFDRATTVRYPRVDAAGQVVRDAQGAALEASITRPGRTWIEQVGPTCAVTWPLYNASQLRLEGWLNIQHVRRRLYGDLPEEAAGRIREAGRRGTRKILPNVALTVRWNL